MKINEQKANKKLVKVLSAILSFVILLSACGEKKEEEQFKEVNSNTSTSENSDITSDVLTSSDTPSSSQSIDSTVSSSFSSSNEETIFDDEDISENKPIKDNSMPASATFVPTGYEFVWGDDFDGKTLDKTKWNLGSDMKAYEDMILSDSPEVIKVEDGLLQLNAIHYFDRYDQNVEYALPYAISTADTMNFKYGYVEMRAKVPFEIGAWPSLWMKSSGTLYPEQEKYSAYMAEVDIFEVFSKVDTLTPNIHKWYADGSHTQISPLYKNSYTFSETENLSNEFHIYGFEWDEEEMNFFVDGTLYNTFDISFNFDNKDSMDGFHVPLYLIINNFLYSPKNVNTTENTLINNENLPISYDIDWIKLYQKNDGKSKLYQ